MLILLPPVEVAGRLFLAAKVGEARPIVFDRLIVLPEPEPVEP